MFRSELQQQLHYFSKLIKLSDTPSRQLKCKLQGTSRTVCLVYHCPCWWPQYRWLPSIFKVYFNRAMDSLVTGHNSNSWRATKGTTPGSLLAGGTLILSRSLYLMLIEAEEPSCIPSDLGCEGIWQLKIIHFLHLGICLRDNELTGHQRICLAEKEKQLLRTSDLQRERLACV